MEIKSSNLKSYKPGLVSIITPAYNSAKYIKYAIDSVINQSYSHWEMIIVNDCSEDNTEDIVLDYIKENNNVYLYNLSKNSGAAVARNIALEKAKGQYIAFLDSDDYWHTEKLKEQISFMDSHSYGFTFTGYQMLNNGKFMGSRRIKKIVNYSDLLKFNYIGCLTVVIDRNIIGDFSMVKVRKGQDHLTWLMILEKGYFAYGLNSSLAYYRLVKGSLSYSKYNAMKRQYYNYREVLRFSCFKTHYYMIVYLFMNLIHYLLRVLKKAKSR